MDKYLSALECFESYLNEENIKYTEIDSNSVSIKYDLDKTSINYLVAFDDHDDSLVAIRAFKFVRLPDDKYADVLILCDAFNKKYRWVKFYTSNFTEVVISADAIVDPVSPGEELVGLIHRLNRISNEVYPQFMKIIWT